MFLKWESGDFNNLQDSLHANPHALSSGQVKLDSEKGKLWNYLFELIEFFFC